MLDQSCSQRLLSPSTWFRIPSSISMERVRIPMFSTLSRSLSSFSFSFSHILQSPRSIRMSTRRARTNKNCPVSATLDVSPEQSYLNSSLSQLQEVSFRSIINCADCHERELFFASYMVSTPWEFSCRIHPGGRFCPVLHTTQHVDIMMSFLQLKSNSITIYTIIITC